MQIKNSSSFIKSFMVGLIASSAGAFVALPSSAMPETTEVGSETEVLLPEEVISEPSAEEALPTAETEATEAISAEEISPEADALAETDAAETEAVEEASVEEEASETVAEEDAEEMPVAEEAMEEESVADSAEAVEEPAIAEEAVEEPVATEETTEDVAVEEAATEEALVEEVAAEEITEIDAEEALAVEETETEAVTADEAITEEIEAPVAEESLESVPEETAAEEMNTADFTIAELTSNSDSFEILTAALEAADLSEILGGEGPFTVFAPTDEAFEALPEGAIEQLLMPENKEVLIQVLTYHVVPGAVLSTELETGAVATVEGSELAVEVDETVTVNNANVIAADVTASNGVIHVIDSVILPPAPEADADVEDNTASAQ